MKYLNPRGAVAIALGLALGWPSLTRPAIAQDAPTCQISASDIARKNDLRREATEGNRKSQKKYDALVQDHRKFVEDCRRRNWPKNQAVWLRLYPCDIRPGALNEVLDQVVNQGYNQVYVEVFYSGKALLPQNANNTAWPSVIDHPDHGDADLLAQAIAQGRQRGLKVYAWMYGLNMGVSYTQSRGSVLARNAHGQTSLELVSDGPQAFVDPYNPEALRDYTTLVQAIAQRRPDGILFDYIRYPRASGAASAAGSVKDLLIHSPSAREALVDRATNNQGRELIRRFLNRGYVDLGDLQQVSRLYPQEAEPLWQGRIPPKLNPKALKERQQSLQQELWLLSVAHAYQGVVDFLTLAAKPVQENGIAAGAVFFPGGNRTVGRQGFDSRMQPWNRFPTQLEWHPMAYADCGTVNCILNEVQEVLNANGGRVQPALAGAWGRSYGNRPSLEAQMQALRSLSSRIDTVSHFAYSWQQPEQDASRKACRL